MFFYIGQRFTTKVRGGVWRTETCEQCHRGYAYYGEIEAWGVGESPYMLDDDGAKKRASEKARRSLESYAKTGVFAIPCPHCGAYQRSMFRLMSRPLYKWMYNLGITLLFLSFPAFLGGTFLAPAVTGADEAGSFEVMLGGITAVAMAVLGVVLLIGRPVRQRKYDPNASIPEEERLATARNSAITIDQFNEMQKQAENTNT